MSQQDLPIEFKSDYTDSDRTLYVMIEDRLRELAKGHTDIVGAAARLEQPAAGRETPYIFEANVVVYSRPNYVNATEKHKDPRQALKGALDAVERQVRTQRAKLKEDRGSLDDFAIGLDEDAQENED